MRLRFVYCIGNFENGMIHERFETNRITFLKKLFLIFLSMCILFFLNSILYL